jgi:hypothetical protein
MSNNTLVAQQQDQVLMGRVRASAQREAWSNPSAATSAFGLAVKHGMIDPAQILGWAVCVATEEQYATALADNVVNPGGDPTVISDDEILEAVQKAWPPIWPPVGSPGTLLPQMGPPVAPINVPEPTILAT